MADFYDEERFTLKQDWNWSKIIHKADEWIHNEAVSYTHLRAHET